MGREEGVGEGRPVWREGLFGFSGSGWRSGGGAVDRGQTVGVGWSKMVLSTFAWAEKGRRVLGFRVGVSSSESGVLSSSG